METKGTIVLMDLPLVKAREVCKAKMPVVYWNGQHNPVFAYLRGSLPYPYLKHIWVIEVTNNQGVKMADPYLTYLNEEDVPCTGHTQCTET